MTKQNIFTEIKDPRHGHALYNLLTPVGG